MNDNRFECGCERGDDCTKTTMCAIQSALEDQSYEFEQRIERLEKVYEMAEMVHGLLVMDGEVKKYERRLLGDALELANPEALSEDN